MTLDQAGAITGVYANPQPQLDGFAEIADDDRRLLAFLAPPPAQQPAIRAALAGLDAYMPRGLEDFFAATSFDTGKLPVAAQQKLADKKQLRSALAALVQAATP